jgi:ribosomal protein S12 methylthiotransferase
MVTLAVLLPGKYHRRAVGSYGSNRKVLHYLDLPLQHADDKILNAMNRPGSAAEIAALIQRIRDRIPDIALRTTFICGFPR